MKFTVLSRHLAENYLATRPQTKHIVISISTPGSPQAQLTLSASTLGVLRLWFVDLDQIPDELMSFGLKLFQREDARAILKLVEQHKDVVEEVIIHCDAGMSRSPGVAAALSKIYNGSDEQWFGSHLFLNKLVYRTILNEFFIWCTQ